MFFLLLPVQVASGRYLFLFNICPGFDLGGQVAIGFSHSRSQLPARGQNLPSLDCVHSEASAIPPISEHPEPASCPASLSITPLPTLHSSQETLSDSSTGAYIHISQHKVLFLLPVLFFQFQANRWHSSHLNIHNAWENNR